MKVNEVLKTILIIVAVVAVGMFAVNQTLGFFYKAEFLQTPCELCEELNPHLEECFNIESIEQVTVGPSFDINIDLSQPIQGFIEARNSTMIGFGCSSINAIIIEDKINEIEDLLFEMFTEYLKIIDCI